MDTFCIFPWIHMHVDTTGDVLPCCIADHRESLGNVKDSTIEEIWNSEKYKQMRLNMLQGKPCTSCEICYNTERRGVQSVRQKRTKDFKHLLKLKNNTNQDGSLDRVHLYHFDVRWSNICNFKCRTCHDSLSSSIAKEQQQLGSTVPIYQLAGGDSNDNLLNQFKPYFKDIETFYFAGGEPLVTEQHYTILESLIEQGKTNVALQYNTNLSVLKYKNKDLFELWKKFSNVSVRVSLDSWGKRAEYIRDGTDWNVIENNILEIRNKLPHVRINTSTVVSIFNLGTLDEFLDYLLESKLFKARNFSPDFFNIVGPEYFTIDALDDDTRNKFYRKLESSVPKYKKHVQSQLKNVLTWVAGSTYNPVLKQQFKKEIEIRDKIRNKNLVDYLPELKSYVDKSV